jgi:catechol 2,3-dioxygenase-like lactoylglutathione lyase family enzyme
MLSPTDVTFLKDRAFPVLLLASVVGFGRVLPPHKNIRRTLRDMAPIIERVSAITLRVSNMTASVQLYRNVLGMELLYGGERSSFSSLRCEPRAAESVILNLESGNGVTRWGRIIFHVTDVDAFWTLLKGAGFDPEIPQNASWGERYFHVLDPDGHELSFARPLQR